MVENKRLEIERRLNSFKYWLYENEGLGIEKIIDEKKKDQ